MEDKKKESLDTTLNECESSNKKIIDFIKDWWIIVVIVFFAILVIIKVKDFYFEQQDLCLISQEVESLGQMGDFFGGTLNPILAFLSFCLLLITIKLQSKELKNSTEELAKSSNTNFKAETDPEKIKQGYKGTISEDNEDLMHITNKGLICPEVKNQENKEKQAEIIALTLKLIKTKNNIAKDQPLVVKANNFSATDLEIIIKALKSKI